MERPFSDPLMHVLCLTGNHSQYCRPDKRMWMNGKEGHSSWNCSSQSPPLVSLSSLHGPSWPPKSLSLSSGCLFCTLCLCSSTQVLLVSYRCQASLCYPSFPSQAMFHPSLCTSHREPFSYSGSPPPFPRHSPPPVPSSTGHLQFLLFPHMGRTAKAMSMFRC